ARPLDEGDEAAAPEPMNSYEIRNQFSNLVRQHPHQVRTILALEPMLLTNQEFLSAYPQLADYVARHPEISRSPRFYLSEFGVPHDSGIFGEVVEMLVIFASFALAAFALAWLVRTIIEQKRWNRLSRTQSEVHNKILDRFASSDELLQYVKTPAGSKFLESAPIPLRAEQTPQSPSLSRVMWSVQIGLVVAAGAIGMLLVSFRFEEEAAQELFALGLIGFFIGAGFVVSAAASIILSRRLGLWAAQDSEMASTEGLGDRGTMR
ncbi:MAG TPA: hypothetical protein VM534_07300, partial [Thermoanaerobaculia bacterium]|nr:hypothetical protein [Thermoanaerobaculia bacterium]